MLVELVSVRCCTQKLSFRAPKSLGAVLHALDAACCARLHAQVRKCECLRDADRAWTVRIPVWYSQARGVLFGQF